MGIKNISKFKCALCTFQEIKGWWQVIQVFTTLSATFLLAALVWYFWIESKQLKQRITALQTQNRFLYTGNTCLPHVALTFDDGPSPLYTPQILAILQQYGVKATFFWIGQHVAAYPDLVKQAHADGHVIGNHSWSHPNLALVSKPDILSQLTRTSDAIQQVIGVRPTFFRPPYGAFRTRVLMEANSLGLITVIWDVRATDWAKPGVNVIIDRIMRRTSSSSIILLHDGGGDRSDTVMALPAIIEGLQRDFRFVTLQQITEDLKATPREIGGPRNQAWEDLLSQLLQKFQWRSHTNSILR